jgi:hypothetical protein
MDGPFVKPSYKLNEFNCPYCSTYLPQTWFRVMHDPVDDERILPSFKNNNDLQTDAEMDVSLQMMTNSCEPEAHIISRSDYVLFVKNMAFSKCNNCGKYAIWVRDKLIYPLSEEMP